LTFGVGVVTRENRCFFFETLSSVLQTFVIPVAVSSAIPNGETGEKKPGFQERTGFKRLQQPPSA
jgi:hypothetical protein